MGAIIGILSRLFSGGGLIVLVLLGAVIGVIGDMLLAAFYIYGAIALAAIIIAIIPGILIFIATLLQYILYPFRYLNNFFLGAEKPKFDFMNLRSLIGLSNKALLIELKERIKGKKLAE